MHVVAGYRQAALVVVDPHDLVEPVHLEHANAGDSPQLVLEDALHSGLPDLVSGLVRLGTGVGRIQPGALGLVLGLGERTHIAEQMGGHLAVRVAANGALLHRHSGEQVGPLAQVHQQVGVDVEGHGNLVEGTELQAGQPVLHVAHLGETARAADDLGQLQQDLLLLGLVESGPELQAVTTSTTRLSTRIRPWASKTRPRGASV